MGTSFFPVLGKKALVLLCSWKDAELGGEQSLLHSA